ncbi:unnamed protein product [Auanema sp. JU1783]|nr:unnamed protein product [Auanema sp. JU1783]
MTGAPAGRNEGKLVPLPPDGGWGWVVVLGSFFIHVFADGFVYAFGVLVEELMKEFDSDNTMCALIISLLTGLTLGTGPIASAICNKYGCRTTTIVGAGVAFVGCSLSYFATEMWHIIITVGIIMGFGFGLMYCPAIVIVTMYFEKYRSLATGIAVAGAGVGTVAFSPINAFIMANYGWRSVFLAFLVVLILCALCGATFRPLKFQEVISVEEDVELDSVTKTKEIEGAAVEENAALLVPPKNRTRTSSRSSAGNSIHGGKSLRDVNSDTEQGDDHHLRPRSRTGTVSELEGGYLNRKDVFFTGSITNVAEFKEDPDKYRSTGSLHKRKEHTLSSAKLDQVREASEDTETTDNTYGRNMFKTISKMLSLSLLLEPTFLLFAVSNLLTSVGFNSPLYFLPLHASKGLNLTAVETPRVLSAFGAANTLGRVVFGSVADHRIPLPNGWGDDTARNRLWMYNISLAICGLVTLFSFVFDSFLKLTTYAAIFGFTIASYICLTSVILVDLLGLEKLTNAFGLLLLWQGIGTVFGPPVAGFLADWQGSYNYSFAFCGVNLLISGLMLFAIPYFKKK